jgi:hypothetical protein
MGKVWNEDTLVACLRILRKINKALKKKCGIKKSLALKGSVVLHDSHLKILFSSRYVL